jgi:hypothetical protein
MQRRRVSSGLNWKPHFMVGVGLSRVELEPFCDGISYEISVGTLSDVMPVIVC